MLRADALTQRVVAPVCQCGRRLQRSDPDLECVGETVRNDDQALMNVEPAMTSTADRTLPPQTVTARNADQLGAIPLHHRGITLGCTPVLHTITLPVTTDRTWATGCRHPTDARRSGVAGKELRSAEPRLFRGIFAAHTVPVGQGASPGVQFPTVGAPGLGGLL